MRSRQTLTVPPIGRIVSGTVCALLVAALVRALVVGASLGATVVLGLLTAAALLVTAAVWSRRVELHDDGLTVHGLGGQQVLRWDEVSAVELRAFVPGSPTPAGKQTRLVFERPTGSPRSFRFSADTIDLPPLLQVARTLVAERPQLADDITLLVLETFARDGQSDRK